jgi:hypothetical protein
MSLQYDFEQYRTQSDGQGHFVINNVPPGLRQLVRLYENGNGWSWSHGEPVTVNAGGRTRLQFGGKGRTITGKVVPSDPKREIAWKTGHHVLGTRQPRPPTSFRTEEDFEVWNNSAEVKETRARYRYYAAQFDSDGAFRIEDVPPGAYDLTVMFYEPGPNAGVGMGTPVGNLREPVEVPEMPNGLIDQPLDLGKLELPVRGGR